MWVIRTRIYPKLLIHSIAESLFWQHSFYGCFHKALRSFSADLCGGQFFQTSRITGICLIDLDDFLLACELHLVSIDDDYVFTGVDVRCVFRPVLAPQDSGDAGSEASQNLPFGIYDKPATGHIFLAD